MADGRARREGVEAAGHTVIESGAKGDDQVRTLQGADGGNSAVHAGHAQVVAVGVGEGAARGQRSDHGGVGGLDQGGQGLGRAAADHTATDVEDGGLGVHDRAGRGSHLLHVRAVGHLVAGQVQGRGPGEVHLRDLGGLGDIHEDRAGAARAGQVEGLGEAHRDVLRIRHQEGVLRDGHRRTHDVSFLECVGADQGGADLARNDDDRHGVHAGVTQGGQHVRRAGA